MVQQCKNECHAKVTCKILVYVLCVIKIRDLSIRKPLIAVSKIKVAEPTHLERKNCLMLYPYHEQLISIIQVVYK